jgi:transposase InsO family protein
LALSFNKGVGFLLLRTLTDRGSEYSGAEVRYHYQLFLHLNGIEHSRTKARHPQTNRCTERLNQIIQEEFYAVAFRKTRYMSIAKVQVDLDTYLEEYDTRRTNSEKRCPGRTRKQTWDDGYDLYKKYVLDSSSVDGTALAEALPNPFPNFNSHNQLEDECSKSQNIKNQKVEVVIEELMH